MNLESIIKVRGVVCPVIKVLSNQMMIVEYKRQECLLSTYGSGSITVRNSISGKFMALDAELNKRC